MTEEKEITLIDNLEAAAKEQLDKDGYTWASPQIVLNVIHYLREENRALRAENETLKARDWEKGMVWK